MFHGKENEANTRPCQELSFRLSKVAVRVRRQLSSCRRFVVQSGTLTIVVRFPIQILILFSSRHFICILLSTLRSSIATMTLCNERKKTKLCWYQVCGTMWTRVLTGLDNNYLLFTFDRLVKVSRCFRMGFMENVWRLSDVKRTL